MKTNIWKLAVAGAAVLALLAGCNKPTEPEKVTPKVTITAGSAFVNGAATLTLSLSSAATSEVTVTLGVEGTIPAANLTYANTVKFAAGSTSQTVPVTVKTDGLAGGSYVASFSIKSATGAEVGSPSDASIALTVSEVATPSVVNITASDPEFVNNKATLTLALDKAQKEAVSVTLAIAAEVEGYTAIPAEALTLENPVTFVAGETSKVISITADPAKLPAGESWTVISIASVSENATIGNKKSVYIMATNAMEAKLREDWTVAYSGEEEYEGEMYSLIEVNGLGEHGTYYIFIYEKGTVAANFDTVTEYLQFMEDEAITPALGTANAYQIKEGDTGWLYYQFPVGEYEIWLAGCSATGHLTGEYTTSTFSIEATQEQLDAYAKWLGEWDVTRQTKTDKWVITEKVPGGSFYIQGIDGNNSYINDILVEAEYDAANDQIVIATQEDIKVMNIEGVDYYFSLIGLYDNSTRLVSGDFDLARISKTGENQATIASGGKVNLGGSTYDVTGMLFFAVPKGESNGYVFDGQVFYLWPEKMNKIVANEDDPVFNSYLGTWNITRMDSEWDDATSGYKELGEVADTWTFTPKVAGRSFYISGIEGYDDLVIEAEFNAQTGGFSIKEQDIFVEDYYFVLAGLFYYPGDATYEAGYYINDDGAVLCDAVKNGDTIQLNAGSLGSFGDFGYMQVFQISDNKYFSLHDDGYELPNTLTKAAAPSSVRVKAARAMRKAVSTPAMGASMRATKQGRISSVKGTKAAEYNRSVK